MTRSLAALTLAALVLSSVPGHAEVPKLRVGQCVTTTIKEVGHRLEGVNDSGSTVYYANGLTQVSYDEVRVVRSWRAGDAVKLCLMSLPKDCPRGDDRGKVYRVTNLRTQGAWSAPDAAHMCGGA